LAVHRDGQLDEARYAHGNVSSGLPHPFNYVQIVLLKGLSTAFAVSSVNSRTANHTLHVHMLSELHATLQLNASDCSSSMRACSSLGSAKRICWMDLGDEASPEAVELKWTIALCSAS